MAATNYVKVVTAGRIELLLPFDGEDPERTESCLRAARSSLSTFRRAGKPARMVLWGAPITKRQLGDPAAAPICVGREQLINPAWCRFPRHQQCDCVHFVGLADPDDRRREHALAQLAGVGV